MITTTETTPNPNADLQEAATRHTDATRVIRPITDALDLIPNLCGEIRHLRRWIATTRSDLHNLTAAARATLTAQSDSEPDALYYLRDELQAQGHLRRDNRGDHENRDNRDTESSHE